MPHNKNPVIKVMVIDDVQVLCDMTKDALRDTGYIVMSFTDPVVAVSQLTTFSPDIVLLDYSMPELSGIDVMELINSLRNETGLNIGVLGLSGSHPEAEHRFHDAGVDDYMAKPFRKLSLIRTIERIYWRRHPQNDTE